jgi:cysteate synthase
MEKNYFRHYLLRCSYCGSVTEDDGYILHCGSCISPSLLVSDYEAKEFTISENEGGIFRYRAWLPIQRSIRGSSRPHIYQSLRLSNLLGLKNLWIAFSGNWPERNIRFATGTFKELEAYCVVGRIPNVQKVLVISSAGNTAAAFANVCSLANVPCLIVVPEYGLPGIRLRFSIAPWVRFVCITERADYLDAIRLGNRIGELPGFFLEGGTRNVARRGGLGTVMLSAFEAMGKLPEYYFQAIGSGAGAIAVHESSRHVSSGKSRVPRLFLSQNEPFTPVLNAWRSGRREWKLPDEVTSKRQIQQIFAKTLSNRLPAYSEYGGLFDALKESEGELLSVTNEQAMAAGKMFRELEGIHVEPAASVAFASLLDSLEKRKVPRTATVLLNITGGVSVSVARQVSKRLDPDLWVRTAEIESEITWRRIAGLFDHQL